MTTKYKKIKDLFYKIYLLDVQINDRDIDKILDKFDYNVRELLYSELNGNNMATESEIYSIVLKDTDSTRKIKFPLFTNTVDCANQIIDELEALIAKYS